MKDFFEHVLQIREPWFVERVDFNPEALTVDVYVDFLPGGRFPCPDGTTPGLFPVYDTHRRTWRDLNVHRCVCHVHCRVPRVDVGGKVVTVKPPWVGLTTGFTVYFEAALLELGSCMPVATAANLLGIHDTRMWRVMTKYRHAGLAKRSLEGLVQVGIDETSSKRGHNYVTIFADIVERRVVHVAEGRAEPVVAQFAETLAGAGGDPDKVAWVSCDMAPAFISGVRKSLPNAQITFDKFHLVKMLNEGVDKVRRAESADQKILRRARWAVLKNKENLTEKQREKRDELEMSKLNLKTIRALHIRENFQEIYKSETEEEFATMLKKWLAWAFRSKLAPIVEVAGTIKRHWDGIVSWMRSRISNGLLEGINSLVQAARSRARGYRTTDNYITMIYLIAGRLNFKQINPYFRHLTGPLPHTK